jgi:enamine deaminase RidA (YjgF/YER057c/UK114 family)
MHLTLDNPDSVGAPFAAAFSHVARVDVGGGAILFLSGQVAVDDEGRVVAPGDIVGQTERIFEIIGGLLAAHGASLADVAHIKTFLADLDHLPGFRAVDRRVFAGHRPPASTTVAVRGLVIPDTLVEIEIIAVVRSPQ